MSNNKNIKKNNGKVTNNYYDDEQANFDTMKFDQINDRQYSSLLSTQKPKQNSLSYFKNSQKYAGKPKYQKQEQQQEDEEMENQYSEQVQNEQQSEENNQANGIKQALNQIKNRRKQRSNLLSEDLKAIDREDRQNLIKMKQIQKQQGNPQALQNQLTEFNKLTQIRFFSQKNLQQLKKYPINNYPISQTLHNLQKQSQKFTLTSLQKLVINYQKLASDYFQKQFSLNKYSQILQSNNQNIKNKRLNVQSLWQKFEQQTKQINSRMEQQIINWSQRTTLLRNTTNKSQYNSLLMQTPIGQAKKAITDWEKVSKKCQQKRSPFRILFQTQQNLKQNSDKNIYDDLDLLQEVQKNYEQQLEKQDKDFLINDTLKYLQNKSRTKVTKQVDRKASKNRKIRYNVHAKLLNFMPCQNDNFLQARDQIVKNLFNKGTQKDQAVDFIDI